MDYGPPNGPSWYQESSEFFADDPRRPFLGPGEGPANDEQLVWSAQMRGDADGDWSIVHNLETTEVYALRVKSGGTWSPGAPGVSYVYRGGQAVEGPVEVLGWAKDKPALWTAFGCPVGGPDPVGWLTGRPNSVDWVRARLAGQQLPRP